MPTKKPRINIRLEKEEYANIKRLADKEGVSASKKAKQLIEKALELMEDVALSSVADERLKTFEKETALSKEELLKQIEA